MTKRQSWNSQEDKLIKQLITSYETTSKKIKWAQISDLLKEQNPHWKRTGKQCRERWLNHLKPSMIKPNCPQNLDLELLFDLIRIHGKKWSLIARQLPGRTDNTIKNFFYAAWRKGLRNLNIYNTKIRFQKKYKIYKQDLIDKILSVHDEKKNKFLYIINQSVFTLAQSIQENIIQCSLIQLNYKTEFTKELEIQYEQLNDLVTQFCRICKFKKSKAKKKQDKSDKFQVFTRKKCSNKSNKQISCITTDHSSQQFSKQLQIKLENQSFIETSNDLTQKNIQNSNEIQIDSSVCDYDVSNNDSWKKSQNLHLSYLAEEDQKLQTGSLFELLSNAIPREVDLNSLIY